MSYVALVLLGAVVLVSSAAVLSWACRRAEDLGRARRRERMPHVGA
jgi:hypothetical protein